MLWPSMAPAALSGQRSQEQLFERRDCAVLAEEAKDTSCGGAELH